VSAELARHYGVEVVLPANVEGETVSGSLVLGPRDETLEALGRVLGGRFEDNGTGVYRFTR
jgi:ferric-dicitrate binding protein FerR (iron transport regulator)